jgi:hypothetical protein
MCEYTLSDIALLLGTFSDFWVKFDIISLLDYKAVVSIW